MRYFVRDKVLELLPTLKEAIDYINHKALEECLFVMEDMQAGLDSIRNTFQSAFTVATFSKYEEIVRAIEVQLSMVREKKENQQTAYKEVKQIKYFIDQLQTDLLDEAEVKLEVLFIPYKFSMWDSLESIWLAAEADPRCNSRVMPIPYYDRDENGLLADFHYEVDSFMKHDIPVVSYKEYDYTVIQPDVIYYHNPYDGNNRVTSVSPEFYSDKLKQFTNMMVYVPYYIANAYAKNSTDLAILTQSGIINATKVVVQSQVLKEAYQSVGINEDKLLLLGNPKVDAAIKELQNTSSNDIEKISNRKTILINSTISALLINENYLSELKALMEKIISEDFSIIWRPHPLLEATISSMRAGIKEEYKALQRFVNNHSHIIYDQSEDVFWALHQSDALVTDSKSSIIQTSILSEKPIYIRDTKENFTTEKMFLFTDVLSCYYENEYQIDQFLEMLQNGFDPLKAERINNFKQSIFHSDGTSGKAIHQHITNEFLGISYS